MSRIGKNPVIIPEKVKVTVDQEVVHVEGPKGKLQQKIPFGVTVEVKDDKVDVSRISDSKKDKSLHGTIRNLIANMIKGVTESYKKELEIIGVGYKAQIKGKDLSIQIGFSHPVDMSIPEDIKITVAKPTQITVEGIDKMRVGQIAATIRKVCPPEPYKGKGIRYAGEYIKKKQGKAVTK